MNRATGQRLRRGSIPSFAELDATPRKSLAEMRGKIRKDGYKGEVMRNETPIEQLANRLTRVKRGGSRRLTGRRIISQHRHRY